MDAVFLISDDDDDDFNARLSKSYSNLIYKIIKI